LEITLLLGLNAHEQNKNKMYEANYYLKMFPGTG